MSIGIDDDILKYLPHSRAFARSLARDRDRADDLVKDAVLRVLGRSDQFTPGTNFKAWIFTILRNLHFSELRRKSVLILPVDAVDHGSNGTSPVKPAALDIEDFRSTFNMLPDEQREALVLIAAAGFTYEEVAAICGRPIGTIKSRVARARHGLKNTFDVRDSQRPTADKSGAGFHPRRLAPASRTRA